MTLGIVLAVLGLAQIVLSFAAPAALKAYPAAAVPVLPRIVGSALIVVGVLLAVL